MGNPWGREFLALSKGPKKTLLGKHTLTWDGGTKQKRKAYERMAGINSCKGVVLILGSCRMSNWTV